MGATGYVGIDGSSAVPAGIVDYAAAGENLALDPEIEEKLSALFKETVDSEIRARFKLEVIFQGERSRDKAYPGVVVAWTNGGFAHGGGDEVVYFCPAKVDAKDGGRRTCRAPIDLKLISRDVAVCPTCSNVVKPRTLQGQLFARLTTQDWVRLIANYFGLLGCNADIRIGVLKSDIRRAAAEETERDRGGDRYLAVRNAREYVIYPLKNILKDTAHGRDIEKCIRAFLSA